MRRTARPLATWLAILALTVQTLAFAVHGPFQVLGSADGSLVICTAEGLKRIGTGQPDAPPPATDHVCSACATLAASGIPPADSIPTTVAFASPNAAGTPGYAMPPGRTILGPVQPRAPPPWA